MDLSKEKQADADDGDDGSKDCTPSYLLMEKPNSLNSAVAVHENATPIEISSPI